MTPHPLELVGVSAAIAGIRQEIERAAESEAKVLITGESGVGKEVAARLVHRQSRRSRAPLITINCAGVPDSLLASELFGHLRGSFTDAHRDARGWLEQADRGTIFLDEIGEMSSQMQSLLLRFLETGEIQPIGSERRSTVVDVRVITATNRPLQDRIAAGEFREDLFYRLNVVHIHIPPLRERREDLPPLVEHFLDQFSEIHGVERPKLSNPAAQQLHTAVWPGNVRQLRNVLERLVVRARGRTITAADLPRDILSFARPAPVHRAERSRAERAFEEMLQQGETFWNAVRRPFMARDLTRDDMRAIVRRGLELTPAGYKTLPQLFNVLPGERKRMLSFLRKHGCYVEAPPGNAPRRKRKAG